MAEVPIKTCSTCGQEKPASDFHKNVRASDGLRSSCKPCTREINRKSVLRHHDKRKAEKRADYRRKKDTPQYKEYIAAYQARTKAEKRRYDAARHKAISREVTQRAVKWNRENPERRRLIVKNYDARRRARIGRGISTKALREWLGEQEKKCFWCAVSCSDSYHIDHVIPLSKGGRHEVANLAIACAPCNLRKNAKDPLDFMLELWEDAE